MTEERIDLDRVHALMMAALDGECSDEERRELNLQCERHHELAAEWNRFRRLKEVTTTMAIRQPPEEVWDRYRTTTLHRVERSVAWVLVLFGALVLGGWGLWHWLEDLMATDAPLIVRAAILALVAGFVLLLASVIRERWFLHRRDPYSREVTR